VREQPETVSSGMARWTPRRSDRKEGPRVTGVREDCGRESKVRSGAFRGAECRSGGRFREEPGAVSARAERPRCCRAREVRLQ